LNQNFDTLQKFRTEDYVKTVLYQKIGDLQKALSNNLITTNDCLTLFAASGLDCFNEVLSILILIKLMNFSTIDDKFFNLYNESNEFLLIYRIYKKLSITFDDLLLFKILKNPNEMNKFNDLIGDIINKFEKNFKNKPSDFPPDYKNKEDLWNLLLRQYYSGNLKNKKGISELKYKILKSIIDKEIQNKKIQIQIWSENNFINPEIIFNYLDQLSEILINILTIERKLDLELNEISPLEWIKNIKSSMLKVLKTNDIEEKIMKSFLIGNPTNFAIRLNMSDNFYNTSKYGLYGICNPKRTKSNYIFYYGFLDTKLETVVNFNIVCNISYDYLISCNPQVFNKFKFKPINIIPKVTIKDNQLNKDYIVRAINSSIYDEFYNKICNTTQILSPWENSELKQLYKYFINIRKKLNS
jgi:hypothetical protein